MAALLSQVETAKADAVKEFRASQTFIDSCAEYYGNGFEDCLKQVKSVYPHLDLSKVSMDDPLPSTPAGDVTLEENNDFTESKANSEDDGNVFAQLVAVDKPIVLLTSSANTPTQEAQDLPSKGDEVPQDPPAS